MPFPDYEPTLPEFIRRQCSAYADRELIVFDEERLTYREVEERSARLARSLLARGVTKGTKVGVMMPNGPDWIIACFAVTRIGAVLVPLNTFFQTQELAWILRHADVHMLLTVHGLLSHDYLARLEAAAPGRTRLTRARLTPFLFQKSTRMATTLPVFACRTLVCHSRPIWVGTWGAKDSLEDLFARLSVRRFRLR